jgi:hypothetical protein
MSPSQAPPLLSAPQRFGSRGVLFWVVAAAVVTLGTAACSADTEAGPPTESTSETASGSASGSASGPAAPSTPAATDPLEPAPAEKMLGTDFHVVRADDGTSIVVSRNEYATRSAYRLYDSRWRPLTPMLALRGDLDIDRGLADAFVGRLFAYREKGQPRVDEAVIVAKDGTLTAVDRETGRDSEPVRPRPGDRRVGSEVVYRPSDRTLHRTTLPEWADGGLHPWDITAAGNVCAIDGRGPASGTVRASDNEGRTFDDLSTAVLPADSGPRLQYCVTGGDRVVVETGGEYPRWLHVLDRASGDLLVSHYIRDPRGPYDPYGWHLLPNGKLVIETTRPGLYVATDRSNEDLEFRAHPRAPNGFPVVLGDDDLALVVSGTRRMYYSADEGRSWETVDLAAAR